MKTVKIMLLLTAISFFISIPISAEARDCSNPKGFHEKLMCKIGKTEGGLGNSDSSITGETLKKKGGSFWKKIKNFGGKNIGEPG